MNLALNTLDENLAKRGMGFDPHETPQIKRTLLAAMLVVLVAFVALGGRLWYLQILQGEHFRNLSENNRVRMVDVAPSRGLILDRQGRLLADNRPTYTLAVIPEDIRDWKDMTKKLGILVGLTPAEIEKARRAAQGMQPFKPLRLKSYLNRDQVADLESFKYDLPGIMLLVEYRRAYLSAMETAHVIGYLGEINREELQSSPREIYRMGDFVGRSGLEKSRDRVLHGRRGVRQVEVDAMGRELKLLKQEPAVPGYNLKLTIDLDLQKAAAEALGDQVGAVVAMDPHTGKIYCQYSSPSFDQNTFVTGLSAAQWDRLSKDTLHPLKDRAISGGYPPGSTYKIITAAAGLMEGVITPQTTFFCPGAITFGGREYRCWAHKKGGHGTTDLQKALRESCDVYFYRVGQRLGVDRLAKWARAFGLGRTTGVPLAHEYSGLVPTSQWKKERLGEPWQDGETLSVAIGQGFNQTTPLQLARMISVVANGGKLVTPTLVEAVIGPQGSGPMPEPQPVVSPSGVEPWAIKAIADGLASVVNDPHGTGSQARVPGVTVAGKTGTAQVVSSKIEKSYGREEDIPWKYRAHALFVCYAPVEDPRIAVAVVVEHGGHGGSDAAPVAQKVLEVFFKRESVSARNDVTAVALPSSPEGGGLMPRPAGGAL